MWELIEWYIIQRHQDESVSWSQDKQFKSENYKGSDKVRMFHTQVEHLDDMKEVGNGGDNGGHGGGHGHHHTRHHQVYSEIALFLPPTQRRGQ